jgi:hypothetical protein
MYSCTYKLKCTDCPLQYIGQTGRSFNTRYKDHIRTIRHNNDTSTFAQHILNAGHTYGSIQDTMDIVHIARKGMYMNNIEKYHTYRTYKQNKLMNEITVDLHNPIFEVICNHSPLKH